MKIILKFILFLILFSCQKKKNDLTFKLLNRELNYSVNLDSLNDEQIFFKDDASKNESTNLIKFKLINNSNFKYLLLVNDLQLIDIKSIEIKLYENDKEVKLRKPLIMPSFSRQEDSEKNLCYMNYCLEKDLEKDRLLKIIGFKKSKFNSASLFMKQRIVIYPKESLEFLSTLSLPYLVEDNILNLRSPVFFDFKKGKKYSISLKYSLKEDLKSIIPQDYLKNLEENKIKIFTGVLETQKIPIINSFDNKS